MADWYRKDKIAVLSLLNSDAEAGLAPAEAEERAKQIADEAMSKAEANAGRIIAEAEEQAKRIKDEANEQVQRAIEEAKQSAQVEAQAIIDQAKSDAIDEAINMVTEYEEKARQLLEDAQAVVSAPAQERPRHILRALRGKAELDAAAGVEGEKAPELVAKKVELVMVPPVSFQQMKRLRTDLQGIPGLRIMATGGSIESGATITVVTEEAMAMTEVLGKLPIVEDAVEEEFLDAHPMGDFLRQGLPKRSFSMRRKAVPRLLVLLRTEAAMNALPPPGMEPGMAPEYGPEQPPEYGPEQPPQYGPEQPPEYGPEQPPEYGPEQPPQYGPEQPPEYTPGPPPETGAYTEPEAEPPEYREPGPPGEGGMPPPA